MLDTHNFRGTLIFIDFSNYYNHQDNIIAYYILHTTYYTLHPLPLPPAPCTLHMHPASITPYPTHCTLRLLTAPHTLHMHTTSCTQHIAQCTQHTAHCNLHPSHYTQHTAYFNLHIASCILNPAHASNTLFPANCT